MSAILLVLLGKFAKFAACRCKAAIFPVEASVFMRSSRDAHVNGVL